MLNNIFRLVANIKTIIKSIKEINIAFSNPSNVTNVSTEELMKIYNSIAKTEEHSK